MNDLKGYYKLADGRELKKKLKEKFNFNFSVRRQGRWFHVNWEDGPSSVSVNAFLHNFHDDDRDDIMTDLWCGSQYILAHRDISKPAFVKILSEMATEYHWQAEYSDQEPGGFSLPGRPWSDHLHFEHNLNERISNANIERMI